jgi:hypothetical protein
MGAALGIIISIVGALASGAPMVEKMAVARHDKELQAAFNREVGLYRQYTIKKQRAYRTLTQIEIQRLSWQMPRRAQNFIPPLMSARRRFEIDLSSALVDNELEPKD